MLQVSAILCSLCVGDLPLVRDLSAESCGRFLRSAREADMVALSNWKILYKLLALVGAMSVVIAIVAVVGINGVNGLDHEAEQVGISGFDSALGERIHQNVLS